MKNSKNISEALNTFRIAKEQLRKENVIQHEKPIHCEIAEWMTAAFFEGKRAVAGNQKGWDIELNDGRKVQVKSHAKAATNNSDWTTLSKDRSDVSFIFIVIFSSNYFIREVFKIETEEAYSICNKNRELGWGKLRQKGKSCELEPLKNKFPFLFD